MKKLYGAFVHNSGGTILNYYLVLWHSRITTTQRYCKVSMISNNYNAPNNLH